MSSRTLRSLLVAGSLLAALPAIAQTAVQFDVHALLNARVVFTEHNGQLQPADHALDMGDTSILITASAAKVANSGKLTPLPDSDLFAANATHPQVQLHYAQADGGPQVLRVETHTAHFTIATPAKHYGQAQLFFASAQGTTPLTIHLVYADGSSDECKTVVPDFYFLPKPEEKGWFVLADDFGKVDRKAKMTEETHHYIHGFTLYPDAAKKLVSIDITKEDSGSVLNLFGATGVVAK